MKRYFGGVKKYTKCDVLFRDSVKARAGRYTGGIAVFIDVGGRVASFGIRKRVSAVNWHHQQKQEQDCG